MGIESWMMMGGAMLLDVVDSVCGECGQMVDGDCPYGMMLVDCPAVVEEVVKRTRGD